MPNELLRYAGEMKWLQTVIRPCGDGVETEIHFSTAEGILLVAVDNLPSREFLITAINPFSVTIEERTPDERGWIESDRFCFRLNDDDEIDQIEVEASSARFEFADERADRSSD